MQKMQQNRIKRTLAWGLGGLTLWPPQSQTPNCARALFLFAAAAKRDTNCNKTVFYSSTMDLQRGTTLNYICPGFGSTSKPALGQVVGAKEKQTQKR